MTGVTINYHNRMDLESSRLCVQEKYARALRMERRSKTSMQKLADTIANLEEKNLILEDENDDLKYQLEQLQSDNRGLEAQLQTKYHQSAPRSSNQEASPISTSSKERGIDNSSIQEDVKKASARAMQETLNLEEKLQKATLTIAQLQSDIDNAKNDSALEMCKVKEESADIQKEVMKQQQLFTTELSDLQLQITALQTANEQLQSESQRDKIELVSCQERLQSAQEELLYFQSDVESSAEEVSRLEGEVSRLDGELQVIQTKQQDAQSIHTQTDPDTEAITNLALVVSLQQENADLTYQVGDLQDKLNDAIHMSEDAQEQLDALQNEKSGSSNEEATFLNKHKLLEEQHQTVTKKLALANEEIDRITRNWKELVDNNDAFKKEVKDLKRASEKLHASNVELRAESDAYVKTIGELQDTITSKDSKNSTQIANLKGTIHDLKQQIKELCGNNLSNPTSDTSISNKDVFPEVSRTGTGSEGARGRDTVKRPNPAPFSVTAHSHLDGNDSSAYSDDEDDYGYGSDEFETDEGSRVSTSVAKKVSMDNSQLTSPVRGGVRGMRQMSKRKENGELMMQSPSKRQHNNDVDDDSAEVSTHLYRASESAPLLPSLNGNKGQQSSLVPGVRVKGRSKKSDGDTLAASPNLPDHHPYYKKEKSKKVTKKSKKKSSGGDDVSSVTTSSKKKSTKKKSSKKGIDVDSHGSSPHTDKNRPSCAECGFHFVGSGMKLPTTLQQVMEDNTGEEDMHSVVSAGYNTKPSHKSSAAGVGRGEKSQEAVRDLYGWRRGEGCVFCCWGCARKWNQKHTPVQLKYQTDRLITIASGGQV